jgi:pSer/pThr/pTyr-binding forkhead associated (FHA) protein
MASHHDLEFDSSRPALVLLFGNAAKKHHTLDNGATVIGRARGCDLGLEAPDVSSIHCVITRGSDGYHVRDCLSRAGTKHNGKCVKEADLRDGDLLQIGPFSFRVHLPSSRSAIRTSDANKRLEHLVHSRRNLARIALRQRRMIRLVRVMQQDVTGKAVKDQLNQQIQGLKARVRDYDQRVRTLEDAERDLAHDRETLDRQMAAFQAEVEHAKQQPVPSEQLQAFEQQKKEFFMTREQSARDQASLLARFKEQQAALAQMEETLRQQRQSIEAFVSNQVTAGPATECVEADESHKLRAENEELRQLLARVQHEREQDDAAGPKSPQKSGEIASLRRQLQEKDTQLAELRANPSPHGEGDADSLEAELTEFRRQLENDRKKLNTEIEQVRARNKELDEATREMELEMSKERADLARERQRLERLRDEVRLELERLQRDGGLRDRLTPVQTLRDEINSRRNPGAELPSKPTNEEAMQARLRTLRSKVNEQ